MTEQLNNNKSSWFQRYARSLSFLSGSISSFCIFIVMFIIHYPSHLRTILCLPYFSSLAGPDGKESACNAGVKVKVAQPCLTLCDP